jgi:hypothetical protein
MKIIVLSIFAVMFLQVKSCSDSTESSTPPLHINLKDCGKDDQVLPRAEAGDSLCVGREDCYQTSGSPEGGCPNTCSCVCMYGVCYQNGCTLVGGCTEPPIYR